MEEKKMEVVPGLAGIPAAESAVSFVDGVNGVLEYRGININELAGGQEHTAKRLPRTVGRLCRFWITCLECLFISLDKVQPSRRFIFARRSGVGDFVCQTDPSLRLQLLARQQPLSELETLRALKKFAQLRLIVTA